MRGAGLSPRTRGNRPLEGCFQVVVGSIPANAGEPIRSTSSTPQNRVYPRERGGTILLGHLIGPESGLSPRTRGNPRSPAASRSSTRSIPANAGEPEEEAAGPPIEKVYPRETRGNLVEIARRRDGLGSIPANAGEPFASTRPPRHPRVYPRERGGTLAALRLRRVLPGLSPRTRGNPEIPDGEVDQQGSIPANAGEPPRRQSHRPRPGVYPRERGGTAMAYLASQVDEGLSPRTRGNHPYAAACNTLLRSIPANAGEPGGALAGGRRSRVYPRERGGTRQ